MRHDDWIPQRLAELRAKHRLTRHDIAHWYGCKPPVVRRAEKTPATLTGAKILLWLCNQYGEPLRSNAHDHRRKAARLV